MALFEASRDWPYSVAWLDCLARGAKLGRALLTRGAFMAHDELPSQWASDPLRLPPGGQLRVPVDAPSVLLNRVSVGLFNALYYHRGRARTGTRPGHFAPFFFPLDRLAAWNRLYGQKGFVQYQCVLPKAESASGLAALLTRLTASGQGSFLAVLKLFGPGGEGLMSFPMQGYTLALDLPLRPDTPALLAALDGYYPPTRRARLPCQGCLLHTGAGARGLSRSGGLCGGPGRGCRGRAAIRFRALTPARAMISSPPLTLIVSVRIVSQFHVALSPLQRVMRRGTHPGLRPPLQDV